MQTVGCFTTWWTKEEVLVTSLDLAEPNKLCLVCEAWMVERLRVEDGNQSTWTPRGFVLLTSISFSQFQLRITLQ